jgi:hypothetical protein
LAFILGTVTSALAEGRRRRFDDGPFHGLADYLFETMPGLPLGPQALIARQAPGWELPTHFHMQHQFQVVLEGQGLLGRHRLVPGSVHYTSPQSAYGPTVSGPDGLSYFTLRVLTDKGAWYLPQSRQAMDRGLFKEQVWGIDPHHATGADPWCELIPPRADGLAAWIGRLGEGETAIAPDAVRGGGRFHLVLSGSLLSSAGRMPAQACLHTCPDESAPSFTPSGGPGIVVVVQFPRQALTHDVPMHRRIAPSPKGTPA